MKGLSTTKVSIRQGTETVNYENGMDKQNMENVITTLIKSIFFNFCRYLYFMIPNFTSRIVLFYLKQSDISQIDELLSDFTKNIEFENENFTLSNECINEFDVLKNLS